MFAFRIIFFFLKNAAALSNLSKFIVKNLNIICVNSYSNKLKDKNTIEFYMQEPKVSQSVP